MNKRSGNGTVKALKGLVALVGGGLLCFYGFLAWRGFTWSPTWWIGEGRLQPAATLTLAAKTMPPEVAHGRRIYYQMGCAACHGLEGQGRVKNPNAKTGEEVPSLLYVAEGYKPEWLKKKLEEGVPQIVKKDPGGREPPLRMPAWKGRLQEAEMEHLMQYLFWLYPGEDEEETKGEG